VEISTQAKKRRQKKMSEQKRAVIYARSATVQDEGSRFTRDQQVEVCKEYALEQGYEVVEVFSEAFSGIQYRERPELSKIRRMAQDHDFDVLLINTYDRLSRSQVHLVILLDEFENQGICVECVQEQMDTVPTGQFLRNALKLIAQTKKES
jgi:site-specific DNA recombinase